MNIFEDQLVTFDSPSFVDQSSFCIFEMIENLKQRGLMLAKNMIFWFDYTKECYIFLGKDPLPPDMWILFDSTLKKKVMGYLKVLIVYKF